MPIPNEDQKIVTSSENYHPVPIDLRAVMPRNERLRKSSMDELEYTYKYEFQHVTDAGRIRAECITEKEK